MLTEDELLALMKRVDPETKRVPPGVRAIANAIQGAERERIFSHIRSAMGHAEAGYDDVAWRLLASLVGPNDSLNGGA